MGRNKIPEYKEKLVIYIPVEFKQQVQEYIDEFNNSPNILAEDIEELKIQKDNEDVEYISKKVAKKQKTMIMIYLGIVIMMIVSIFIAAMFQ